MQHGDAVDADSDPDRPLSSRGREDVSNIADELAARGTRLDAIVHSGKLRAMQTADLIAEKNPAGSGIQIRDDISPRSEPQLLCDDLANHDGSLLIVSHMPFVAELVSRLTGDDPATTLFTPGTVVNVRSTGTTWESRSVLDPSGLR